ncbi:MAG TPA: MFS transporter [Steroidobacteraceae bacterium]|jgi:MFS family permease|nr:MFS transporter [Steroidobacteraceae bacterium]
MGTNTPSHELIRNWPILVVAFILVFLAFGIPTYSLPFMYGPAMKEFGWSNAEVNLLSTAKFVIGAVAALGMGILVDRLGGRLAVLIGTVAGGIAMALFLFATNLPVYYLAGAMLGFSASSIVAAMKVIISRLYTIHQGAAMGIVLTATSTGGVVMPWIWAPLLQAGWNWRTIIAMMCIGPFLIAAPLWMIFVARSKKAGPAINAPSLIQNKLSTWQHFKLISRDRNFWLIAIGIFLVASVDQAVQQNTVQFLVHDKGMNINKIAWASSLIAVLGIAAKIGSGWFYDRTSIRGIRFFYVLLAISTWLILPVVGPLTLTLFIVTRGMAHGGMIVDVPILTRHYFGLERLGLTIGIMSVADNLGYAAGPPLLGWLADINHGSFVNGMLIYGAVAAVAVVSLLRVAPRFWVPPAKRREQEAHVQAASSAVPPTA